MTVDFLRTKLNELIDEYPNSKKQLQKDIVSLDAIMARNFDATWNVEKQCYEQ